LAGALLQVAFLNGEQRNPVRSSRRTLHVSPPGNQGGSPCWLGRGSIRAGMAVWTRTAGGRRWLDPDLAQTHR